MSAIKPGTLCRFVCNCSPVDRDRIVTAVRPILGTNDWLIDGPWFVGNAIAMASCLRPISDPDLDTENQNDAMDMNLLTVLPFTRESA